MTKENLNSKGKRNSKQIIKKNYMYSVCNKHTNTENKNISCYFFPESFLMNLSV